MIQPRPNPDTLPPPTLFPATIVVDTRENAPYHFLGIPADGGPDAGMWIVPTDCRTLKTGDYSLAGFESRVCIERKSASDLRGSITHGRDRLEAEFERMAAMEWSAIVVEAPLRELLDDDEVRRFTSGFNPKVVSRTWMSWAVRFPRTHWMFCEDRRHAEMVTFHLMRNWWKTTTCSAIAANGSKN